jgi:hypothetical protein
MHDMFFCDGTDSNFVHVVLLCHCMGFGFVCSAGSTLWPLLDRVGVLGPDRAHLHAQLEEEHEKKAAEMNTSVAVVQ